MDKQGHLTFSEQREVTKDDPMVFGTNPPVAKLDQFSMPEISFTSEDILRNPVLIKTFSWKFTDAPLANLAFFSIPGIVASTASFHQLMLKTYAYYRPQFTIRVQVNSTKFHQGRLAAWYDPFNQHGDGSNSTQKKTTRTSITGLPHSMIDASLSNVVEFDIPFEHIQTALTTNSSDTLNEMGRYNVTVFNALRGASGTSSEITVNVYLAASIIKLHVPIHPHEVNVQNSYETQSFIGEILGTGSKVLENGSNAIWNLLTGNFSGAARDGSRALAGTSNLLRTFNLDKPTNPLTATVNTIAKPSPITHCNGVDSSIRLGNSSMGGYLCHTEFSSTTEAEMEISNLIKIPMFIGNSLWQSTTAPNTILATIPLTPSFCNSTTKTKVFNYIATAADTTKAPVNVKITSDMYEMDNTYLSYISSLFCFWRGPLKVRADIVSTQFHTGRLGFQFVPNHDLTDPAKWSLSDRSNDPLTIFDIHEMKSIEVEVPFFSSTMSKTWAPITSAYKKGSNDWISDNNIIGYLHVYVLNKLTAPSNVSADVEINFYMSAGENFELDVLAPKPNIGASDTPWATQVNQWKWQLKDNALVPFKPSWVKYELQMDGQSVPTRSGEPPVQTEQTRGPGRLAPYNRFGDQLKDVREIGRRYVRAGVVWLEPQLYDLDLTNNMYNRNSPVYVASFNLPVTPFVGLRNGRSNTSNTEFNASDLSNWDYQVCSAAVARMYATWHGSMRYKFVPLDGRKLPGILEATYIPDDNAWTPIKTNYPDVTVPSDKYASWNWTSYPSLITHNNQNAGLEVEVPYYSAYQQLVTEGNSGGKLRTFVSGHLRVSYTTTSFDGLITSGNGIPTCGFQVYQALGDDFSFGFPVSPPRTYYVYNMSIGAALNVTATRKSEINRPRSYSADDDKPSSDSSSSTP